MENFNVEILNQINLKETFDVLDNIYNIKDLEDGVISKVII